MQNKLYKITGVFLLLLSSVSIMFELLAYLLPQEVVGSLLFGNIVFAGLILPSLTLPLVLLSGIYFLIIGFKNKTANKVIFASAIIQLISLPSLVLAFLLGLLPCLSGPPDGFCMLFGTPFMFLDFFLWIVGSIVLVIGIIIQKRNQ